jgi:hypothetical protein
LAHHGALNHNRLAPHVQRVRQLYAQLDTRIGGLSSSRRAEG